MHVMAPEVVSTCGSRSAKGEWVEKVYDYATAWSSLKGIISDMQVIEEFESRPHKAITFVVERGKERQERNEQKLPKAPGKGGGRRNGDDEPRTRKKKGGCLRLMRQESQTKEQALKI